MIYFLIFFIGTTIGAFIGFILAAVLTAGGHSDDLQRAYERGLKDGRNNALKDINEMCDKYKDLANGHNNDVRC